MKITKLGTNHMKNPIGYWLDPVTLSYQVAEAKGTRSIAQRIEIGKSKDLSDLVFDSGRLTGVDSKAYVPPVEFEASARYYWRVTVWDDQGDCGTSETAFFEMPPDRIFGKWIAAPFKEKHAVFMKKWDMKEYLSAGKTGANGDVSGAGCVRSARLYICGLGLYVAYINGVRVGNEFLSPFYNDYNHWIQFQSYDVTELLQEGENALGVMLGNGWYCGRFSPLGPVEKLYGDRQLMICDIVIETNSGQRIVISSDESFWCHESPVLESSIYDGEVYDSRKKIDNFSETSCDMADWEHAVAAQPPAGDLQPRRSLPLTIHEQLKPVEVLKTPAGETVLDFGQIITGIVRFRNRAPEGAKLRFWFGECLQNGNFYNENLRTAKQELIYYSDGKGELFCPRFTYYGFRYVKVAGVEDIRPEDYTACALYSDMERTGEIRTSNPKVNRLFENALWGQKGNFADVPTDCPQRDERLGWTGDAQIFCATACFNMYVPGFFHKYLYDMYLEQKEERNCGAVPYVVPDILAQTYSRWENGIENTGGMEEKHITAGSCAWGDAAVIIPWTLYLFYGNKEYLKQEYEGMKLWTDFIYRMDEEQCGGRRLWTCGFHFADWLALDNFHEGSRLGGTDPYFVASAYYFYSAVLTAKAAKVLGNEAEAQWYGSLADEVRAAIQKEYFTSTGRIAADTQTAMVLALHFGIVSGEFRGRLIQDLRNKLEEENIHLTTGFVGTAYLCNTLSENGLSDCAYTLLLNEDYPSWLYEVNMGATTIWERWNSILPDGGIIKGAEMNSLNHYAYGAVVEWMYRHMCGLNPDEDKPGFRSFILAPKPDPRLEYARMTYESPYGLIVSSWEKKREGWQFVFQVPFNTTAEVVLPEMPGCGSVIAGDQRMPFSDANRKVFLGPGEHRFMLIHEAEV